MGRRGRAPGRGRRGGPPAGRGRRDAGGEPGVELPKDGPMLAIRHTPDGPACTACGHLFSAHRPPYVPEGFEILVFTCRNGGCACRGYVGGQGGAWAVPAE